MVLPLLFLRTDYCGPNRLALAKRIGPYGKVSIFRLVFLQTHKNMKTIFFEPDYFGRTTFRKAKWKGPPLQVGCRSLPKAAAPASGAPDGRSRDIC